MMEELGMQDRIGLGPSCVFPCFTSKYRRKSSQISSVVHVCLAHNEDLRC